MAVDRAAVKVAVSWLQKLARLTRYKAGKLDAEEKAELKDELALFALVLLKALPSGAFTSDSLAVVSDGCEFFPSAEFIRTRLRSWWEANGPVIEPERRIGDGPVLSAEQQGWVRFYRSRLELIDAPGYRPRLSSVQADRDSLASLVRQQCPAAYAKVVDDQPEPVVHDDQARDLVLAKFRSALPASIQSRMIELPDSSPLAHAPVFPDSGMEGDELKSWRTERGLRVV